MQFCNYPLNTTSIMNGKITGRITAISALEEIPSQRNNEKMTKMQIIVEEENVQFPESVAVTLWNEKATNFNHLKGDLVTVSFSCRASQSKEGRFFNELKAWRVD